MAKRYVEVSKDALVGLLTKCGFVAGVQSREVVYVRPHAKDGNVKVKVYTSLAAGQATARGCGEDAIRVVVFYDNGQGRNHGVKKLPKILRTGSEQAVLDRLLERMREAYGEANEYVKKGSPDYSRSRS